MREESELVTGEAVVLDLRVAKLASRGVAMLIDVAIQVALLVLGFFVLLLTGAGDDGSLLVTLILVFFVLIMVGYPVLFETFSRGRSLGKLAMGLRVVRTDGGPIRFRHALTRALAGFFLDFWALGLFGAVAVIVSLVSSDGRRVGDYLAGTLVIRERVSQAPAAGFMMPPGLGPWAAQLDLSHLTNDVALTIRQFLTRFAELRPEASARLGDSLAQQVAAQLGVPVPPGIPAWAYLMAILAERRNRDQVRAGLPVYPPQPYGRPMAPQYAQTAPPQPAPAAAGQSPVQQFATQPYAQPAPLPPVPPGTAVPVVAHQEQPPEERPFAPPG